MRIVAIWAMIVLASGCAALRTVRDEKEAIGLFRSTDIGGTREIELRRDHSCVMSSYTASGKAPLVHATWSFNGGFVTISPISTPPIFFEVARRSFEVVLISPSGRGIYVRIPEKEPNKSPEPTAGPVTNFGPVFPNRVSIERAQLAPAPAVLI